MMEWLDPPFQFFHPHPHVPFDLTVMRWEVGLSIRQIDEPPGAKQLTTIRFHLPGSGGWGLRPYVDFTNRILMQRVFAIYKDLIDRSERQVPFPSTALLRKIAPSRSEVIILRLTRLGTGLSTVYDVEVLGG
jgi:hypothetical protein